MDLDAAPEWDFESIKLLAIGNLAAFANPIVKITLGRRYNITKWLPRTYEAICTRADSLNLVQEMKSGMEDAVRILAAR